MTNYVYDKMMFDTDKIDGYIQSCTETAPQIPEYVYDVHTRQGKRAGKTKKDFFRAELDALANRQLGLFDNLIEA